MTNAKKPFILTGKRCRNIGKGGKTMSLDVYTLQDAAKVLKLSQDTVRNYIKAGKLHAVKIGRGYRLTEEDLRNFLAGGTEIIDRNRRPENRRKKSKSQ